MSSSSDEEYSSPQGAYYVDPPYRSQIPQPSTSDRVLRSQIRPVPHSHSTYNTFSRSTPLSEPESDPDDSLYCDLRQLRRQLTGEDYQRANSSSSASSISSDQQELHQFIDDLNQFYHNIDNMANNDNADAMGNGVGGVQQEPDGNNPQNQQRDNISGYNVDNILRSVTRYDRHMYFPTWYRDFQGACTLYGYNTPLKQHNVLKHCLTGSAKVWSDLYCSQNAAATPQQYETALQTAFQGTARQRRSKAANAFLKAKKNPQETYTDFCNRLQFIVTEMDPAPAVEIIIDKYIEGVPQEAKERIVSTPPDTIADLYPILSTLDEVIKMRQQTHASALYAYADQLDRKQSKTKNTPKKQSNKEKKSSTKKSTKNRKRVSLILNTEKNAEQESSSSSDSEAESESEDDEVAQLTKLVQKLTTQVSQLTSQKSQKEEKYINAIRSRTPEQRTPRGNTPHPPVARPRSRSADNRRQSPTFSHKLVNLLLENQSSQKRCFECQSFNHLARQCPQRDRRYNEARSRSRNRDRSFSRDRFYSNRPQFIRSDSQNRSSYRPQTQDRYYRERSRERYSRYPSQERYSRYPPSHRSQERYYNPPPNPPVSTNPQVGSVNSQQQENK
jgi:hypothetical protein